MTLKGLNLYKNSPEVIASCTIAQEPFIHGFGQSLPVTSQPLKPHKNLLRKTSAIVSK